MELKDDYGYTGDRIYTPHDIKVRELIAGKTRWQALIELGYRPILVNKHSLQDGIEQTRQFLSSQCVVDPDKCPNLLAAIQMYRKRFDRSLGVELNTPVHDEASHWADALRYLAMGHRYKRITDIYVNSMFLSTNMSNIYRRAGYDI